MFNELKIKNFKCLENESFALKNLTIFTGVNSSGKSSVIQSLMLMSHYFGGKRFLTERFLDFPLLRNRFVNAKEIVIELDQCRLTLTGTAKPLLHKAAIALTMEKDLYRISEDRIGPEELAEFNSENKLGDKGQFIFSFYEQNKSNQIEKCLVKTVESTTLAANVDFWLTHILDKEIILNTDRASSEHVKISYKYDELENISPHHLGAGVSYLAKVLIVCLLAQQGNTVIIENPEIHLHPKAQSKLGEFLAFIASNGVQLIIETHCEHIINRIRYEVYKNNISHDDAVIYYKSSIPEPFEQIDFKRTGHFINQQNSKINFPTGFFDSTLDELLEMG